MAQSHAKIPVAVIGVGEHGRNHARQFREIPAAELVGVYDLKPELAQAVAAEFGVRAFGSFEEVLRAARAVSVVIPTAEHARVACRALEQGADVLVEKPIARSLAEADAVIESARRHGRVLQVGHLERFNPGVIAARAVTRRPLFFEVHRLGVFSARSLDVDVVFDLMIHDLDLVLWMVDSPVRDVRAVGLPVLSEKTDIANARVEFENGTVANFTASRVSTEKVRKFRYFQPHEYFSIDFTRRDALVLRVNRNGATPSLEFRKLETRPAEPLRAELEAFVESVRSRRPPLVGGAEGRAALALAHQVMTAIEEHAARVRYPLLRPPGHSGEV